MFCCYVYRCRYSHAVTMVTGDRGWVDLNQDTLVNLTNRPLTARICIYLATMGSSFRTVYVLLLLNCIVYIFVRRRKKMLVKIFKRGERNCLLCYVYVFIEQQYVPSHWGYGTICARSLRIRNNICPVIEDTEQYMPGH